MTHTNFCNCPTCQSTDILAEFLARPADVEHVTLYTGHIYGEGDINVAMYTLADGTRVYLAMTVQS